MANGSRPAPEAKPASCARLRTPRTSGAAPRAPGAREPVASGRSAGVSPTGSAVTRNGRRAPVASATSTAAPSRSERPQPEAASSGERALSSARGANVARTAARAAGSPRRRRSKEARAERAAGAARASRTRRRAAAVGAASSVAPRTATAAPRAPKSRAPRYAPAGRSPRPTRRSAAASRAASASVRCASVQRDRRPSSGGRVGRGAGHRAAGERGQQARQHDPGERRAPIGVDEEIGAGEVREIGERLVGDGRGRALARSLATAQQERDERGHDNGDDHGAGEDPRVTAAHRREAIAVP